MAILDYDGNKFHVGAQETYDGDGKLIGYTATASTCIIPPDQAGNFLDRSISSFVPGPLQQDREATLKRAIAFVRINWDAQKAKRQYRVGDHVGHIRLNYTGIVVSQSSGASVPIGRTLVQIDGSGIEEVQSSELVFLPD